MGILAKKLPEHSAEMLIEQFLCMDDRKLLWNPNGRSSTFPQYENALKVLEGKNLVRKTAQNEKYVVYEYVGPETKQTL